MSSFFSVIEIAKQLKVHPITVRRYIREGKLKALKVGGSIRISGEALENFTRQVRPLPRRPKPTHLTHRRQPFSLSDPLWRLKGLGAYTEPRAE